MSTPKPNMSRVRMTAQERLDLPDFLALQDMVDDQLQLQLGALLGRGGGVFAPFTAAYTTDGVNRWMELTPFQYYWSSREPSLAAQSAAAFRGWRGGISQYNPNAPGQATKINYTAALAANVPTTLYAKPLAVNTDTDARRKFTGGTEQTTSIQTRTTITTQFKFSTLAPDHDSNDGWAPIMYIGAWVANEPSGVYNISLWDSWSAYAVSGQTGNYASDELTGMAKPLTCLAFDTTDPALPAFDGSKSQDDDLGLLQLLMLMRRRHQRVLDPAGSLPWYSDPPLGMKPMYDSLNAALVLLYEQVALRESAPIPWAAGYVAYHSGSNTFEILSGVTAVSGTPKNCALYTGPYLGTGLAGDAVIEILNVPSGYSVVSAAVTNAGNILPMGATINQTPGVAHYLTVWNRTAINNQEKTSFYFTVFISKDV